MVDLADTTRGTRALRKELPYIPHSAWCSGTHLPNDQPRIECGGVNQQPLEDIPVASQARSPHASGLI